MKNNLTLLRLFRNTLISALYHYYFFYCWLELVSTSTKGWSEINNYINLKSRINLCRQNTKIYFVIDVPSWIITFSWPWIPGESHAIEMSWEITAKKNQ